MKNYFNCVSFRVEKVELLVLISDKLELLNLIKEIFLLFELLVFLKR